MRKIVEMISDAFPPDLSSSSPKQVGVNISGGLDSTIILHHAIEKAGLANVVAYTIETTWNKEEVQAATKVANHYSVRLKIIPVHAYVDESVQILKGFERPVFNLWPWFIARHQKEDGIEVAFIGEGADEHFGGYLAKEYMAAWADHLIFVMKTYRTIYGKFGIPIEAPFTNLNWQDTIKYHENPQKVALRKAYEHIIPDFVLAKDKAPPSISNYKMIWEHELKQFYHGFVPMDDEEIKKKFNQLMNQKWGEANKDD